MNMKNDTLDFKYMVAGSITVGILAGAAMSLVYNLIVFVR